MKPPPPSPPHVRRFSLGLPRLLAPVFASALAFFAAFPPLDLYPAAFVALVPLLVVIRRGRLGPTLAFAFVSGFLSAFLSLSWLRFIEIPGVRFGYLLPWGGLSFYVSLYFAAFALWGHFAARRSPAAFAWLAPCAWTALELYRSRGEVGFAWIRLGDSLHGVLPAIQIADVTGVYGLSFLIVLLQGGAVHAWLGQEKGRQGPKGREEKSNIQNLFRIPHSAFRIPHSPLSAALLLWLLALGYGGARLSTLRVEESIRVSAVQGNIPISLEDTAREREAFDEYLGLTRAIPPGATDLVVWPETMIKGFLADGKGAENPRIAPPLRAEMDRIGADLLAGAFGTNRTVGEEGWAWGFEPPLYNSAYHLRRAPGPAPRYDKVRLVPFGEFIPYADAFPLFRSFVPAFEFLSSMGRGKSLAPFAAEGAGGRRGRFAVLICFEDTIAELARAAAYDPKGGKRADFLVNISNDGWFGWSHELEMHQAAAIFRAVENRVGLVRAANTGVSSFVSPTGKVEGFVEGPVPGGILGTVRKNTKGVRTLRVKTSPSVTIYQRVGDLFGFCLGAAAILGTGWALLRRRNEG